MSRWWGWWRPIDPRPTRRQLQRDLRRMAAELAAAHREADSTERAVDVLREACRRRDVQLAEARRDVARLERVRAVLADEGDPVVVLDRARQVLAEGGGNG